VASSAAFPNGNQVPLSAFTQLQTMSAPITINHQGQFPVITLSFNLAPKASLGEAIKAVNDVKDSLHMPLSVQGAFQGTAAAFEGSLANQPMLILAALVTVYIVLGVLYESYIHPVTILSTLPSAGVGALLALFITGNDFTIIALIGIVLLIGIVKKNAIMMIDFALEAEREHHKPPEEAIFQASLLRFRPIMMTTMAALLGGLPLALGSGTRRRAATSAGHHDRGRPHSQPVADALHHACDLSVLRQACRSFLAQPCREARDRRRSRRGTHPGPREVRREVTRGYEYFRTLRS
jgi:multidrug efflux pump